MISGGLERTVENALSEDVGSGDVTTAATVPESARARAVVIQKAPGVIFGLEAARAVFAALDPAVVFEARCTEGVWRSEGEVFAVEGPAQAILTGERTALNFLGRLSGIATLTARCVREVEGTGTRILDTRKTTPGLRELEKAAVRAGGGTNHRIGLFDMVLIKENHAAAAGSITAAVNAARALAPDLPLEVEVRTVAEIDEALAAGAEQLLLDNMDLAATRAAVAHVAGRATLEASGNMSPERLRAVAETGVDFISLGALTHSAPVLDLSLLLEATP